MISTTITEPELFIQLTLTNAHMVWNTVYEFLVKESIKDLNPSEMFLIWHLKETTPIHLNPITDIKTWIENTKVQINLKTFEKKNFIKIQKKSYRDAWAPSSQPPTTTQFVHLTPKGIRILPQIESVINSATHFLLQKYSMPAPFINAALESIYLLSTMLSHTLQDNSKKKNKRCNTPIHYIISSPTNNYEKEEN